MNSFNEIFERLDDGSRISSPALHLPTVGKQDETVGWNAYDARLYHAYASARVFEGMSHDEALATADKQIWNKSPNVSVVAIR